MSDTKKILLVTGVHVIESPFGHDVSDFLRKNFSHDPDELIIHHVRNNKDSCCDNIEAELRAYTELQKQINLVKPSLLIDLHHGLTNGDYEFVIMTNHPYNWFPMVWHDSRFRLFEIKDGGLDKFNFLKDLEYLGIETLLESYSNINGLLLNDLEPSDHRLLDFIKKGEVYDLEVKETALYLKKVYDTFIRRF